MIPELCDPYWLFSAECFFFHLNFATACLHQEDSDFPFPHNSTAEQKITITLIVSF